MTDAEPSYLHSGRSGNAAGWWQGHEAWSNLCAGGTMGVVYGAAGLWQWRLHPQEPGHEPYFLAPDAGWREALDFEGSTYVGLVGKILRGQPITDMGPDWTHAIAPRALVASGKLFVVYRENGGDLRITDDVPPYYRIVEPRNGEVVASGKRAPGQSLRDPGGALRVYLCTSDPS